MGKSRIYQAFVESEMLVDTTVLFGVFYKHLSSLKNSA